MGKIKSVVLRKMHQDEYPTYCEYFLDDYSREIAQNYGHSIDVALELAKKDLHLNFPNGFENNNHSLLCIDANVNDNDNDKVCLVGYLWHSINKSDNSTFIYDFFVEPAYRGKGLGKLAIAVFENQLSSAGISQINLRVAYHNKRAFSLYQKVGFTITGINMSKNITLP